MEFSALRDRAVGAIRNYFNRGYDAAALLGFAENTPIIRTHLLKLYSILFSVSMSSALGSLLGSSLYYHEFLFAIYIFVAHSMLSEFRRTPPLPQNEGQRINLFLFGSFFAWACVTPLLAWLLGVDEGFVVSLLVGVCASFGFFRMVFKQPDTLAYAYFMALAYTVIFTFAVGTGDSASKIIFWLNLGFSVYVVAYSQEVVVRVLGGDDDFVTHAVHLYTHFPALLVNLIRGIWNMRRNQNDE